MITTQQVIDICNSVGLELSIAEAARWAVDANKAESGQLEFHKRIPAGRLVLLWARGELNLASDEEWQAQFIGLPEYLTDEEKARLFDGC